MDTYKMSGDGQRNIFFSGICGISLSSLAIIASESGKRVRGSDTGCNQEALRELGMHGIEVVPYHSADNLGDCGEFVYTAAISADNPELLQARRLGIPVYSRAEYLGKLISGYSERIGVSGTHGKSTVCGMISEIFSKCGLDCTSLIGARTVSDGKAYRVGTSDTVIFEACEYKRSFLSLDPTTAVVLNIEKDHTDCYGTVGEAVEAFGEYIKNAKRCVLSFDDKNVRQISENALSPFYFSLSDHEADMYAENISESGGFYTFDGFIGGKKKFTLTLSVPGLHNVRNALAAMSAAYICGLDINMAAAALSGFCGMKRRFEYIGSCRGAKVYDDYAHHPTEIKSALRAARGMGFKEVVCAFQPHTYSRTAALYDEFLTAFSDADKVVLAEIFAARETNELGISSKALADGIPNAVYIPDFKEIERYMRSLAKPGTLLITMGAGELDSVARRLAEDSSKDDV